MGHKNQNKHSLVKQVQNNLDAKLAIGHSKLKDKIAGTSDDHIYSWETYRTYLKHCCYFVQWCKQEHGCKTLQECRPYIIEWMKTRETLSAYTQKLELSALAKLYHCRSEDFGLQTKSRQRSEIKRSRNHAVRDQHFKEDLYAEFVAFCRSTGLRRAELKALRGTDLYLDPDGSYYIHITRGSKGGRERYAPITGDVELVCRLCSAAGDGKVFPKLPSAADIHSYRAEYATQIYLNCARPIDQLTRREIYYCRKDRKGDKFDRAAMLEASRALGHNRINIIAEHCLRL